VGSGHFACARRVNFRWTVRDLPKEAMMALARRSPDRSSSGLFSTAGLAGASLSNSPPMLL
jgi:hypothetical protein